MLILFSDICTMWDCAVSTSTLKMKVVCSSKTVVSQVGCSAHWWAVGLPRRELDAGPSESVVRLFTTEVTLDYTLGNWYHFIKAIQHIKNLLTLKQLLNVVSYFIVTIFIRVLCKPVSWRIFSQGRSVWNKVRSGPEHCS
jgi:hypothetical protein